MLINAKNPWGSAGGLEAQRSDLWVLDFENVRRALQASTIANRLELPLTGQTTAFARRIAMPESKIQNVEVKRGNIPVLYPAYDDAPGEVRVDFLVDADSTYSDADNDVVSQYRLRRSQIYSLLYGWRILTRIGREPFSSEDIAIPLPNYARAGISSLFKFDVNLYFLKGVTADEILDVESYLGSDILSSGQLSVSSAYVLKRCWISSLQFNDVDQAATGPVTLSSSLIPEEIYPLKIDGQVTNLGNFTPLPDIPFRPGLGLV